MYSPNNKIKNDATHPTKFISAYEELIDNNRKLFNIPSIDDFFYFQDKKNISIINRCKTTHFLYHLIAKLCIEYSKNNENNKTILIDGGGNNLGCLYIDLIKLTVREQFNTNQLLNNIILSRAFTSYQLSNVIINELPTLIQKLNCEIQIIVLDIFDILFSSSTNKVKSKSIKNISDIQEDKIKLLDEILQNITSISKYCLSILAFTDFRNIFNKSISSCFNQILEIDNIHNNQKSNNKTIFNMKTTHAKKSLIFDSILEIV